MRSVARGHGTARRVIGRPQRRHRHPSTANTRHNSSAQVRYVAARPGFSLFDSAGRCDGDAGGAGTPSRRQAERPASTPWVCTRGARGGGTRAASRSTNSSGVNITPAVPSAHGRLTVTRMRPVGVSSSRVRARAGRAKYRHRRSRPPASRPPLVTSPARQPCEAVSRRASRTTRCTSSAEPCLRRSTVTMVQRSARTRPTESPWSAARRRLWTTPSHVRSSASDASHRRRLCDNCQSSLPDAADRHALLGSSTCPPRTAPWRSVTPPRAAPGQPESHGSLAPYNGDTAIRPPRTRATTTPPRPGTWHRYPVSPCSTALAAAMRTQAELTGLMVQLNRCGVGGG
ncbi:MAG: hypothetical protein ACJARS_000371 [bacterium]|jgi:hypothetical protein